MAASTSVLSACRQSAKWSIHSTRSTFERRKVTHEVVLLYELWRGIPISRSHEEVCEAGGGD